MKKFIRNTIAASIIFTSTGASALDFQDSKHLFERAGVGVLTEREYQLVRELSREEAVDRLLSKGSSLDESFGGQVGWLDGKFISYLFVDDSQKELAESYVQCINTKSKAWLPYEMINNTNPILERMLVFWHGHFVTSLNEVNDDDLKPKEMLKHFLMYRQHALGNYKEFVREMTHSWFMLIYLNGNDNVKGENNNNFAREILELFTLGVDGGYTEDDIWELAIALTGYKVDEDAYEQYFDWDLHDKRPVTFMGEVFESEYSETRNIKFERILDKLMSLPQAHDFIIKKIWDEFIVTGYNEELIKEIKEDFARDYDLKKVVEKILKSDDFWAEENRKNMVKEPFEALMGAFRFVGLRNNSLSFAGGEEVEIRETNRMTSPLRHKFYPKKNLSTKSKMCVYSGVEEYSTIVDILSLLDVSRMMTQDFYSPPSVSGWKGGDNWINTQYIFNKSKVFYYLEQFADIERINSMDRDFIIRSLSSDPDGYSADGKDNVTILKELLNSDEFLMK